MSLFSRIDIFIGRSKSLGVSGYDLQQVYYLLTSDTSDSCLLCTLPAISARLGSISATNSKESPNLQSPHLHYLGTDGLDRQGLVR